MACNLYNAVDTPAYTRMHYAFTHNVHKIYTKYMPYTVKRNAGYSTSASPPAEAL